MSYGLQILGRASLWSKHSGLGAMSQDLALSSTPPHHPIHHLQIAATTVTKI